MCNGELAFLKMVLTYESSKGMSEHDQLVNMCILKWMCPHICTHTEG